ncbi:recombinase family protein, partial [Salmonella enterica]|uniref:recombinase family protein n=1 Tax=Salmonella enterica TaxID=28901 RepID=UPI002ADEF950
APTNFVCAYLRASTAEQDASRSLETIEAFARERGLIICSYYIENESGSRLDGPELFRLLRDCQQTDILLIEDVDRLSRLSGEDWNTLKKMIRQKDIRVMAVNVPMTWINSGMREFDVQLFAAINDMPVELLPGVARRNQEQ